MSSLKKKKNTQEEQSKTKQKLLLCLYILYCLIFNYFVGKIVCVLASTHFWSWCFAGVNKFLFSIHSQDISSDFKPLFDQISHYWLICVKQFLFQEVAHWVTSICFSQKDSLRITIDSLCRSSSDMLFFFARISAKTIDISFLVWNYKFGVHCFAESFWKSFVTCGWTFN